jgi:hypothetical protein
VTLEPVLMFWSLLVVCPCVAAAPQSLLGSHCSSSTNIEAIADEISSQETLVAGARRTQVLELLLSAFG